MNDKEPKIVKGNEELRKVMMENLKKVQDEIKAMRERIEAGKKSHDPLNKIK